MAQLDKELFVEYIYWIFLVLLHFYSNFFVNKTIIQINVRAYVLKYLNYQIKNVDEQQQNLKHILENFYKNFHKKKKN